jgi:hypothetical protein
MGIASSDRHTARRSADEFCSVTISHRPSNSQCWFTRWPTYVPQSVMSGQVQARSLPGRSSDVLLRVALLKECAERAHIATACSD